MIKKETVDAVTKHLARIAEDTAFRGLAVGKVNQILGRMVKGNGQEEIAADAIHEAIIKTLEKLDSGDPDSLFSELNLKGKEVTEGAIKGYVLSSVHNYCVTRAERWSGDTRRDKGLEKQRSKPGLEHVAARARHQIPPDRTGETAFWDDRLNESFDPASLDAEKAQKLLNARGLKDKDIEIINKYLEGYSFTEMARDLGGSEDKYRKIYKRAVEKADLEL